MDRNIARVLSIQSHVVHGYVGNKCAIYALQSHGIEADPINTVQFSNNTGYPTWKGQVLQADQLWDIYQGLIENNLVKYTHVLTGYVNNPQTLQTIVNIIKDIKQRNPSMKYYCDPVMGDGGELYKSVPIEMVQLYKDLVFPLADTIKLNQTEIEYLTDTKISNEEDAWKAIDQIHSAGVSTVVISSIFYLGDHLVGILGSTKLEDGTTKRYTLSVPKKDSYYTGTGDLFSALLLAFVHKFSGDVGKALHYTVSAIQAVIRRSDDEDNKRLKFKEIRLIQSAEDIRDPVLLEGFVEK